MTVWDLLDMLASGMTEEEILADFPPFTLTHRKSVLSSGVPGDVARVEGTHCHHSSFLRSLASLRLREIIGNNKRVSSAKTGRNGFVIVPADSAFHAVYTHHQERRLTSTATQIMSKTRPHPIVDPEARRKAVLAFNGSRQVAPDAPSAQQEVRELRKSHRRMNQYMPEPESLEPESGSK